MNDIRTRILDNWSSEGTFLVPYCIVQPTGGCQSMHISAFGCRIQRLALRLDAPALLQAAEGGLRGGCLGEVHPSGVRIDARHLLPIVPKFNREQSFLIPSYRTGNES